MKLKELVGKLKVLEVKGDMERGICGVQIDSRQVEEGHLFMAVRGTVADGHSYIGKAVEKGAVAVLCEEIPAELSAAVTYVRVENVEQVVGQVATTFYGDPTSKLKLVGVTGTNGKTTIATVLYEMFRYMGHKAGLLSTVCNYVDG
ncbi:MAG: UDP-N-acetylmuramoyl-L-alanyl-D-glutamate--2,6-diaminopimelate ligase, partial [Bacteroidaceae bacterium]|nr:UDP-N-acetylmuramoyl-L-alanyl-D-glutamate--2,6-diaminopimelate ligase [Bacteroidaceae bacterium]